MLTSPTWMAVTKTGTWKRIIVFIWEFFNSCRLNAYMRILATIVRPRQCDFSISSLGVILFEWAVKCLLFFVFTRITRMRMNVQKTEKGSIHWTFCANVCVQRQCVEYIQQYTLYTCIIDQMDGHNANRILTSILSFVYKILLFYSAHLQFSVCMRFLKIENPVFCSHKN